MIEIRGRKFELVGNVWMMVREQESTSAPAPQPQPEPVKQPQAAEMPLELHNDLCSIQYRPEDKQISGRGLTDRYNEPCFYTTSKRGINKAWAALVQEFAADTTMRDAIRIIGSNGVKLHSYCAID